MKKAIQNNSIAFQWENQAKQYPQNGSGITYFKGNVEDGKWVDCLLYYGEDNELHGILNHYPFELPPYQKRGSINLHVRLDKRRNGIARALLDEAIERFQVNLRNQEYTPAGERFIKKYMRSSTKYKLSRPRNSLSLKHIVK
jgi:GNAT superfamily N-acetyltransferase